MKTHSSICKLMYTLSKCIGYYCDYFQVKADTQKGIMLAIDVLSNYIKK